MANKFKKAVEQRNEEQRQQEQVKNEEQNKKDISKSKEKNKKQETTQQNNEPNNTTKEQAKKTKSTTNKRNKKVIDLDSLLDLEDNRKVTKAYYLDVTVIEKIKELAVEKTTKNRKINESQIVNEILKSVLFK